MRRLAIFALLFIALCNLIVPSGSASPASKFTVVFQSETLPANAGTLVEAAGGRIVQSVPEIGMVQVEGPATLMARLDGQPVIQAVSPTLRDRVSPVRPTPADAQTQSVNTGTAALYNLYQWDIKQVTNDGASFGLSPGSHSTVVGIVDSGINTQHQDLRANLLGGRNFVPDGPNGTVIPTDFEDRIGHGTFVAGDIAGNGLILGVGPNLGLRVYRVFGTAGFAELPWIIAATVAAANDGVDVINLSLGGFAVLSQGSWTDPTTGLVYPFRQVADFLAYRRAVQYATQRGSVVVAAAGNDSLNITNPAGITDFLNKRYGQDGFRFQGASRAVPTTVAGVVTVAATARDSSPASYTNYGSGAIDLSAPGGDARQFPEDWILSAFIGAPNSYAFWLGTSFAAPKVAAAAALLVDQDKAHGRRVQPAQVTARLQQTAISAGQQGDRAYYGPGIVNAYQALSRR